MKIYIVLIIIGKTHEKFAFMGLAYSINKIILLAN